jgi:hypothetical protein
MDDILAGAVYTNSGRDEPVPSGDSVLMHQFTDKRMGMAKRPPLITSYVTDFDTYDAQLMQSFHARHVHAGHAGGSAAAPSALVEIAFDLGLKATSRRKWDTAAAARGGSISKSPLPPATTYHRVLRSLLSTLGIALKKARGPGPAPPTATRYTAPINQW